MSSIRNKVLAVIAYLTHENEPLSVAKVCKLAEVSRANLYSTYPDLVAKIQECGQTLIRETKIARPVPRGGGPADLKRQLSILAYSCIELRTALDQEREKSARLAEEISRLKRRQ